MTVEQVLQRLREMGCKLTPQRRLIVEVLLNAGDAELTADEIYQQVRAVYPEVGLDTIYRNLRLMGRLNVVTEVRLPGRLAQYSLNRTAHAHSLVCLECGAEIPMSHCPIKELEAVALEQHGFVISSHRIELFGYCPACAARESAPT
ncbi:Fur family transcriptional regulator [Symbiobacterium terraclitae]|uniref:Fur family transcriptional regulator n=1 Tax=Symbiobacterium terraclitae TaxID=557451 RepID=UPI0035B519C0